MNINKPLLLRLLLLTATIIACYFNSYSQNSSSLKVLSYFGKPGVIRSGANQMSPLKISEVIERGDQVVLNSGEYIYLSNMDGNTLFYKTKGTSTVAKIAGLFNNNKKVLDKFAGYLTNEIIKKKNNPGNMEYIGAVTRRGTGNEILVDDPVFSSFFVPVNNFRWFKVGKKSVFRFIVLNDKDSIVYSKELKDTLLNLDLIKTGLWNDRNNKFKWFVCLKADEEQKSDINSFNILGDEKINSIKDSLKLFSKELNGYSSPAKYFMLAKFYERNNLNFNALTEYEKAISSEDVPEEYKSIFIDFLLKQDMERHAKEVWNKIKSKM